MFSRPQQTQHTHCSTAPSGAAATAVAVAAELLLLLAARLCLFAVQRHPLCVSRAVPAGKSGALAVLAGRPTIGLAPHHVPAMGVGVPAAAAASVFARLASAGNRHWEHAGMAAVSACWCWCVGRTEGSCVCGVSQLCRALRLHVALLGQEHHH